MNLSEISSYLFRDLREFPGDLTCMCGSANLYNFASVTWVPMLNTTRGIEKPPGTTPPSKSLASLWLAGQLVVIPLPRWPFFQKYHTEYFQISYDKCWIYDNNTAMIILAENINFRSYMTWLHNLNMAEKNIWPACSITVSIPVKL